MNCPLTSSKPFFINSLQGIGITSMFIHLFVNKSKRDLWKLCRHHHGHHGKVGSLIADIVEMKEMKDIPIHTYIETRWIDLYPQDDTVDDSGLQLS